MQRIGGSRISNVTVIGAGIVGVSTALWLQRMGARVTVLDKSGWGAGASAGNGGILAACSVVPVTGPGLIKKAPGMLMNPAYPLFLRWSYAPRLLPWLMRYLAHANTADTTRIADGLALLTTDTVSQHAALCGAELEQQWMVKSDYSYAYVDRAAFDADAFGWSLRAKHGLTPTIRSNAEVQAREPSLAPHVGLLATMADHGFVRDPLGYVRALGTAAEKAGVRLVTATAHDIEMSGGHVSAVLTDSGRIACDQAVICTGAWSKPLMKKMGLTIPLETERGYHIVFRNARNGPNHPIMLSDGKFVATPMAEGVRCAGIVEFGGLEAGPSKPPFDLLRKQTKAAFPDMVWDAEIEWQGHRPAPADSLPLIGEIPGTGLYTGFGHHHVGLTAGPKTGRILAQLITGQPPNLDLTPYAPTRFA